MSLEVLLAIHWRELIDSADAYSLFVTPDLIAFCGHPCTSLSDKYNSPLLHLDVLDILTLPKHADQKRMRQALKQAIDYGTAISLECGIRARSVPR